MGFDITYHPMTPAEMQTWLFGRLAEARSQNFEEAARIAQAANLDEKSRKDWFGILKQAAAWNNPQEPFEPTYGYALCAAQTFFVPYWYTRGLSFTFLADIHPVFERYLEALPASEIPDFPSNPTNPYITENWRSGAWMSAQTVGSLLSDLDTTAELKAMFESFYTDGQAEVVYACLRFAADSNRGILEASDVSEPNPLDITRSSTVGSLRNLDMQGVAVYRNQAIAQLKAAGVPGFE